MMPIGDDKLKISLTGPDMDELGLVYGDVDYRDENTKRVLLALLERAREATGFSPRGAKLFVEVYPDGEGCAMIFTLIRKPTSGAAGVAPAVFEFGDASTLIRAATNTFARYSHRIYQSSLYLYRGKYHLIVDYLDYSDKLSVYFLSEYGAKLGESEIMAAHTREHGKALIENCALDVLAKYFG